MKIRLGTIRFLIKESLLLEKIGDYVAYEASNGESNFIIACDASGEVVGGISVTGPVTIKEHDVYRVRSVATSNPRLAISLFETALSRFEKLVPDHWVSPPAKAVINRWYQRHVNDGSIINIDDAPLKSIYMVPKTGLRSVLNVKKTFNSEQEASLVKKYGALFMGLYASYD